MELLKSALTQSNILNMAVAAGAGLILGVAATGLVSNDTLPTEWQQYQFLTSDQEVLDHLMDLRELLSLSTKKLDAFHHLCAALDVLVGYDHLIETGASFRLDLNYTIQSIQHACTKDMVCLLNLPCRIPAVATQMCSIVEKLQEKITNIAYNMNQEIRLRIMESKY